MLPNLIIIGAQKCGTTALHHYLGFHPEISMSQEKELNFFIEGKNWEKGRAWYESWFTGDATVFGEGSPDYTNYPAVKCVPERMHALVPDAKLIYMVRHPIERIVSQYMHNRWSGVETRPIEQSLRGTDTVPMDQTRYIRRSKYFMQLQQFLKYYPKSHILVLTQEDLFKRREETLRRVFRFLAVDENFQCAEFANLVHESSGKSAKNRLGLLLARGRERGILRRLPQVIKRPAHALIKSVAESKVKRPQLDEGLRRELHAILKDDIEEFRKFTGRPFPDWSV
jgi:hypothetical protein